MEKAVSEEAAFFVSLREIAVHVFFHAKAAPQLCNFFRLFQKKRAFF
jgi:hypothetical protein